nr:hypothetical protein [Saprospiraceae bacterium]
MNEVSNRDTIIRITALWAFTEAGLGGVLHLFKPPFSGLVLCGLSIIYLSMIARHSNYSARVILQSVLLVVLVKILVSPHSGIMAYFAVSFQGVLAAGIFSVFKKSTPALFLFSISAMLESALQKLIILTVLFGMDFWDAVNEFGLSVYLIFFSSAPEGHFFSWAAVSGYLFIYLMGGVAAAVLYLRITRKIDAMEDREVEEELSFTSEPEKIEGVKSRKNRWINRLLLIGLLCFTVVFSSTISDWSGVLYILLRTVTIILVWIYLVNPLLFYLLKKMLKKRLDKKREEVANIRALFPWLKVVVSTSWKKTEDLHGLAKMENFLVWTFYFLLRK